jgi:hypothetical protein
MTGMKGLTIVIGIEENGIGHLLPFDLEQAERFTSPDNERACVTCRYKNFIRDGSHNFQLSSILLGTRL